MNPGVAGCVWRAYLDFSRTVHGINKTPDPAVLKKSAHELLEKIINESISFDYTDACAFDKWHEKKCINICEHYSNKGFDSFSVGQAQKWINMAIKYALSLHAAGMLEIKNHLHLRKVAHVPVDNYIIAAFSDFDAPKLLCAWSRIFRYEDYMAYQSWIREKFQGSSPLDVEFHLWLKQAAQQRGRVG